MAKNCLCDCTYQKCPDFWTCDEHCPEEFMEPNAGEGEL